MYSPVRHGIEPYRPRLSKPPPPPPESPPPSPAPAPKSPPAKPATQPSRSPQPFLTPPLYKPIFKPPTTRSPIYNPPPKDPPPKKEPPKEKPKTPPKPVFKPVLKKPTFSPPPREPSPEPVKEPEKETATVCLVEKPRREYPKPDHTDVCWVPFKKPLDLTYPVLPARQVHWLCCGVLYWTIPYRGIRFRLPRITCRMALIRWCIGLYAMTICVLGFVFPLTYFLSEGTKDNGVYLSVFHIYLYMVSLTFLVYTHISIMYFKRQLRSCDVKLRAQYKKGSEDYEMTEPDLPYEQRSTPPVDGRASTAQSRNTDNDADGQRSSLQRSGTLGTMEKLAFEGLEPEDLPIYYASHDANFFMRIGVIAFGLGSVVLDGFRLVQFAHTMDTWRCYGVLFLIHTCLRLVFIFVLTFFLFKNHKIVVNFNRSLMRLGMLHVLVTVACICFLSVVMETAEAYFHLTAGDDDESVPPATTYKILSNGNDSNNSDVALVAPYRPHRCLREYTMADAAAPFLYPCVVQFSLLAVVVLRRMYRNMGARAAVEMEDRTRSVLECQKATTGLFLGLLMATATVIAIVFYLLFKAPEDSDPLTKEAPVLVYFCVDLCIIVCSTIATILAFLKTRHMQYTEPRRLNFMEFLLALGLGGLYALIAFMMIPAITGIANPFDHGVYPRLQCAAVILTFVQATLQTIFVIDALRRRTVQHDLYKAKPGRSLVTFILLCNICLWLLRSFEWKSAHMASVFIKFYGTLAWVVMLDVFLPLTIFFRFHSSVCLAQVWVDVYRRSH